jgi:hypothetical protein
MKKIPITALFLSFSSIAFAQQIAHIFEPLFYNDKSFYTLQREEKILDFLEYEHRRILVKVKTENGIMEFLNVNDSVYYNRHFVQDSIIAQGAFLIHKNKPIFTDTLITFDPETYEEDMQVIHVCKLIKTGNWSEIDSVGNEWYGAYNNGIREGFWNSFTKWHYGVYFNYENGQLVGISPTDKASTEQYFKWLFDKKLTWCSWRKYFLEGFPDNIHELIGLSAGKDEQCLNIGEFHFSQNGTFHFKNTGQKVERTEGIGLWRIVGDNQIQLQFRQSKPEVFEIEYLGIDSVRLKKD